MIKLNPIKKLHLDKQQSRILTTIAVATAISVFCLAATKVMISNGAYKRRVINARHQVVNQLRKDITQSQALINQFQIFEGDNPKNIIGGKNTTDQSATPPDGNNSRIVLDALPSSYDFPALLTSMAKILNNDQIGSPGISGSDTSASSSSVPSPTPQPQAIPLTLNGQGNYGSVQALIKDLERSIRPFDVLNLSLQGASNSFSLSLSVNTYYQPPKILSVGEKEVR